MAQLGQAMASLSLKAVRGTKPSAAYAANAPSVRQAEGKGAAAEKEPKLRLETIKEVCAQSMCCMHLHCKPLCSCTRCIGTSVEPPLRCGSFVSADVFAGTRACQYYKSYHYQSEACQARQKCYL